MGLSARVCLIPGTPDTLFFFSSLVPFVLDTRWHGLLPRLTCNVMTISRIDKVSTEGARSGEAEEQNHRMTPWVFSC